MTGTFLILCLSGYLSASFISWSLNDNFKRTAKYLFEEFSRNFVSKLKCPGSGCVSSYVLDAFRHARYWAMMLGSPETHRGHKTERQEPFRAQTEITEMSPLQSIRDAIKSNSPNRISSNRNPNGTMEPGCRDARRELTTHGYHFLIELQVQRLSAYCLSTCAHDNAFEKWKSIENTL